MTDKKTHSKSLFNRLFHRREGKTQSAAGRQSAVRSIQDLQMSFVRSLKSVFLRKTYLFGVVALMIGAIVSVVVFTTFLLGNGGESQLTTTDSHPRLLLDVVDELEFWIEDRQSDYDNSLDVPPGVFVDSQADIGN